MTVIEFNSFEKEQQLVILNKDGKLIGERKEAIYSITLYQIKDYYAEVWQDSLDKDYYQAFAFTDTDQLEPYLKHINISNIF